MPVTTSRQQMRGQSRQEEGPDVSSSGMTGTAPSLPLTSSIPSQLAPTRDGNSPVPQGFPSVSNPHAPTPNLSVLKKQTGFAFHFPKVQ